MKHFHKITCNSLSAKIPLCELALVPVANDADYKITISNAAAGQDSVISFPDPGAATCNFLLTDQGNDQSLVTATASELSALNGATATSTELNYLDLGTLGTGAASKAVVLDTSSNYVWPDTGVLTIGNLATAVETTEHGPGAISTAVAPKTYRWIEYGVIITQTKFDLTGLGGKGGTIDDVIGLVSTAPDAYIGKNVVATNGIIFKAALSCIEASAGSNSATADIDIATNVSGTLGYDEAGSSAKLINGATLVAGQTVENLAPALTADHYFYIVEADAAATDGVYSAGMYVLTTWGHALLS